MELLPCPFCGSPAKAMYLALYNNAIECTKCKCSTPHGFVNIEQATLAWNRRSNGVANNEFKATKAP